MKINKKILSLAVTGAIVTSLSLSLPIYARQGYGQGNGQAGQGYHSLQIQGPIDQAQQPDSCILEPDSTIDISQEVADQLQFMREEEKMARDVYVYLNNLWQHNVFINISKAEQIHMDSVKKFLDAYGISDPILADGQFTNQSLQELYNTLIATGSISLVDALLVGALIEEVDIKDLLGIIEQTDDLAIRQMYSNLLKGSSSHLRAFVNQLESQGVTYSSQGYLTQQQVDDILNGESTQAQMNTANSMDATGSSTASDSCFINTMSKNSQMVVNNTQFNPTDHVALSSTIKVHSQDQGKNAKLIVIAGYTSESGESTSFMRDNLSWKVWDGNINSLSYSEKITLASEQNLNVFNGTLAGQKGLYNVSVGYMLDDGSIIYNAQPMRFSVQD